MQGQSEKNCTNWDWNEDGNGILIRHTDHSINYLFTSYKLQRLGHWFGPLLFTGGTDSKLQEVA
jgi:hypothetical protein